MKAKRIKTGLLIIMLILPIISFATDLKVCKTCKYTSIKAALEQARDGDRILIQAGTYKEGQIIVDKEVQLIGQGRPILDGEYETEILTIEADNVTIKGLEIRNVGTSYIKDRAGIKVETQKNCIIEDNLLVDTFFGIYLAKSKNCIVRNNIVNGNAVEEFSSGNAIHLWYCKGIKIENNQSRSHRDGIYLEFVENCEIRGNLSENNIRYGMHFMFSDHNEYHNNIFRANSAGVAVMFSNHITMSGNLFEDNWGSASYGILLKEIRDSHLYNNTFRSNTIGLYAEGSNRMKIEENNFERNGWALKIMGNCDDNLFTKNNFISNTFELATNSKYSSNTYTQNYWSEYTGYDLDKDGIGDVPHNPIKLFSYIVEQNPPAIVLMRSLFIDLLNFAEKVTPVITPTTLSDESPLTRKVKW